MAVKSSLKRVMEQINLPGQVQLAKPYQHFKGELSVLDGVLLKGTRVVIPNSLRQQMVRLVHEGHLGIEKCKRCARDVLDWPYMNRDIETYVQRCDTCQCHRYQQPKEPMRQHDKPQEPWRKVGMDLFHLKGKDYLLVKDYHSNYPEFTCLNDTTAERVVTLTKAIFAGHGIPVTVICDNGPKFSSQCFKDFVEKYGLEHVTSSPHYPQSNGLVEKGVQIVKRILKKAAENAEDPHLAILNYRASPLENGLSPAEMLMRRKLRTRLPAATYQREKYVTTSPDGRQIELYNRATKALGPLSQEDIVRVRCDGQWGPLAKVVKETTPRSYEVIMEHGTPMRWNRRHLLKVPQKELKDNDTNDTSDISDQACPETDKDTPTDVTQSQRPERLIVKPKRLIEEIKKKRV